MEWYNFVSRQCAQSSLMVLDSTALITDKMTGEPVGDNDIFP